jgi:hypothetical protein
LELRCVIRFLLKDGFLPKEIRDRLNRVYGEDAMKKSQVFFWVEGVRRGREDLRDPKRPGRPSTVDFDSILAHKLEINPHTTVRKLALSLKVSPQTVTTHLREGLGMKCYHLPWVPQLPGESQKAESVRSDHLTLKALDDHARTNYQ